MELNPKRGTPLFTAQSSLSLPEISKQRNTWSLGCAFCNGKIGGAGSWLTAVKRAFRSPSREKNMNKRKKKR
ncbi:hypothetical protein CK203_096197 [Vitis vinifera]|uniref:Uncharacterized protein n=1 Tax=Vitis vinifera TaxID=29760 RepID=A0A438CGN9_VITVI|nr:hypothetical protein CK203_096197 [Vitis vinifera]